MYDLVSNPDNFFYGTNLFSVDGQELTVLILVDANLLFSDMHKSENNQFLYPSNFLSPNYL